MPQIKPRGKIFTSLYEVERIIVDSDFDGVMCGAMLRLVFPRAEIIQSKASEIQEGKITNLITKTTLLADLRYTPACGYFFDHHESNKPTEPFIGEWCLVDSAAHVIYSYFRDVGDFVNFKGLLPEVDKFDSGNITLEDYHNPSDLVRLALIIDREEKYFNLLLIELLARFPLWKVCRHPFISERLSTFEKNKEQISKFVKQNGVVRDKVAFIDTSGFGLKQKMTSYVFTSEFPDAEVVVVTKPHEDKRQKKVRLYKNNFYSKRIDIDLLKVAYKISPDTAGGHKGACGFNISDDYSAKTLHESVIKELKNG